MGSGANRSKPRRNIPLRAHPGIFHFAVLHIDAFAASGGGGEVLFGLVSMTMAFTIGETLADSALWEVRIDGFTE